MRREIIYTIVVVTIGSVCLLGCARAARDTSGFAQIDSAVVNASFEDTWQATKAALREKELNIYTRDKRGSFVAFSEMKRQMGLFTPKRVKLTITLRPVTNTSTEVKIETLNQVYGSTPLTYPDWHDRKATSNELALSILDAIQAKISGESAPPTEPTTENAPAEGT